MKSRSVAAFRLLKFFPACTIHQCLQRLRIFRNLMNVRFIIVFFRSCYIMLPLILQEVSEKNSPAQRIAVLQGECFAEIFTRYERGKTLKVIADSLNKRRFRARKDPAFRVSSLNLILKNRKYIGEYKYADTVVPKGISAIINPDLFERMQERMLTNKKNHPFRGDFQPGD